MWKHNKQHIHKTLQSCKTLASPWTVAARLLCPRDSPSKHTGVGCHSLLQGNPPEPETEPMFLMLPALAGGFFTASTTWEAPPLGVETWAGTYTNILHTLRSRAACILNSFAENQMLIVPVLRKEIESGINSHTCDKQGFSYNN